VTRARRRPRAPARGLHAEAGHSRPRSGRVRSACEPPVCRPDSTPGPWHAAGWTCFWTTIVQRTKARSECQPPGTSL